MAIIRVKKNKDNPYVTINKTALNDNNLSFKAKGIFAYLMSRPDDWKCQVNDLKNHAKDGRDSIYAGLKELREHGYMIKREVKNDKNIIIEWEEVLYEVPQDEAKKIFAEQKIKSEEAALKRANTIAAKKMKNPLTENPEMGNENEKSTYGKSVNGKSVNGKSVNIINNNILNTNLLNNEVSSSKNELKEILNLYKEHYGNISNNRKRIITEFFEKTNFEFMRAVIFYVMDQKAKTHKYFDNTIKDLLNKNINTVEKFTNSLKEHYNKKDKKVYKKSSNSKKTLRFNNFKYREYDYDILEKKLLKWTDEEIAKYYDITIEEVKERSKGIM